MEVFMCSIERASRRTTRRMGAVALREGDRAEDPRPGAELRQGDRRRGREVAVQERGDLAPDEREQLGPARHAAPDQDRLGGEHRDDGYEAEREVVGLELPDRR